MTLIHKVRAGLAFLVAVSVLGLFALLTPSAALESKRLPISTGIYTKHPEGCSGERDFMDDFYVDQKKLSMFDMSCRIRGAQPRSYFFSLDLDCTAEEERIKLNVDIFQVDILHVLVETRPHSPSKGSVTLYEFCPGARVRDWPNQTDFSRSWID